MTPADHDDPGPGADGPGANGPGANGPGANGPGANGPGRARVWRRRLVLAVVWTAAVASLAAVVTAAVLAAQLGGLADTQGLDPIGLMFPLAGAFLISRRPRLLIPWLMWATGVVWSAYSLLFALTGWMYFHAPGPLLPYVAWPAIWLWLLPVPAFTGIMPLLFPDGRLPSRRWRPVLYGNLVLMAGHSLLLGLSPDPSFELGVPVGNPFGVAALGRVPEVVESWIGPPMILLCLLGVVSLGFRYRAATPEVRRQIIWYFYAMVIFVGYWIASAGNQDTFIIAVRVFLAAGIPIAIIAAVLRHQLYGIRLILNRTLVYGTLAVGAGLTYSALIWTSNSLADGYGAAAGLASAMVTGAAFHPVRLRLQRSVDRLFNVERDPYRAADLLSRTVQGAGDPAGALAEAISVVRTSLVARGVGVEVPGEPALSFVDGELGARPRSVELTWHGEPVGRLRIAGARPGREPLDVMAKHLAELAHAVRLSTDLRDSHERISATRDEERRRLGRELHDGLGPTLTSVTMTLDEARRRLERDPESVEELLVRVREEMTSTLMSVRELVDGLRPPVLDELGLAGALRAFGQAPGPRVEVTVPPAADGSEGLPAGSDGVLEGLPAAVETAAYRIVQEALTNVRRHAQATSALVTLRREAGELRVSVADDGTGLPGEPSPGVGLTSMRERAAEIGGTCAIGPRAGGGTEVTAVLPLTPQA
ncbi:sensor histidine kinase [Nonomuraea sp. NPDC001023]|uniref:sensor histidine kinase n=1 Tax=Nonomuraea sp. NPDC001023 TaxID=3154770 RepID=UPI00332B46D7